MRSVFLSLRCTIFVNAVFIFKFTQKLECKILGFYSNFIFVLSKGEVLVLKDNL